MMPYNINDYQPFREGRHPVFTSPENGCKHIGKNVNKQYIRHFKVDGEVFNGPGEERCDYLLLNDEAATSYYIELKGSDLPKAIRQIENTIKLLSPSLPGYAVLRRIVYHTGSHISNDEELGRLYIQDFGAVEIPEHLIDYIDYEAYGRDARINESGHYAPGGYVRNNYGNFIEVYHGREDIPDEHRIFAYPKLNIREQMAAYQGIIDKSALDTEKHRISPGREER